MIYLARHGQTHYNVEDRLGGDSELTAKGIAHAQYLAEQLNEIKLDGIYTSRLKRAVVTGMTISKNHPKAIFQQIEELKELWHGDFNNVLYSDFKEEHTELYLDRKKDKYNWQFPNGESYASIRDRIKPFLDILKEKKGNYAIVGHTGTNRVILGELMNIPEKVITQIKVPHETIFLIEPGSKLTRLIDGKIKKGYELK